MYTGSKFRASSFLFDANRIFYYMQRRVIIQNQRLHDAQSDVYIDLSGGEGMVDFFLYAEKRALAHPRSLTHFCKLPAS